jgi:DNA-binding response OmpR family regulator
MSAIDPNVRINLAKACVLLIDSSQHSLDMMVQIMKGFGVAEVHRCLGIKEAERMIRSKTFDMLVIDPNVSDGDGYAFLSELRHSGGGANAFVPVILVSGHVHATDVARARDTGANYFVAKPITPNVLLQRIMFVSRDKRPFVEVGKYIGPDRRFKFEGPPVGSDGRRDNDLKAPLGSADEPNLSQNEIDTMIKPQRVMI